MSCLIPRHKNSSGFSIVELIIVIVVGITFIASLNVVVNNYTNLGKRDRNLVLANSYAEGKIESLRNIGYNSIPAGTTSLTSELPAQLPTAKSATMVVSTPQAGLKQVDLTINYTEQGINRSYKYATYVGELGVGQ
jgi:type II secretory pathway pseudopilin PulG